ncbi:hypothetical protein J437_LFUL013034 [Ladona fulva]|uniref:Uncharacterized protein n=1 Tax=Ladona fulva TaxID=123851 RepID=A0A8K0KN76_LADFU|nr:hypothetical protein J437_LFUL013034 [Ladona fulva]
MKLMESEKEYKDSSLRVIYNNQEACQETNKNPAAKLMPSKNVQSECNKDIHLCKNSKGRFRNISKCLPQRNHGEEISSSSANVTELEFFGVHSEESKDFSSSMGRKSVVFPIIKKKKLFTPTEQNFLS